MADSQCVLASGALAYDLFLGNASAGEQLANSSFYTKQPAVSKYGWVGASCLTAAAAVCEVEAGMWPCPPPPSPPAAPMPPDKLPPSGPTEGLCEWPDLAAGVLAPLINLAAAGSTLQHDWRVHCRLCWELLCDGGTHVGRGHAEILGHSTLSAALGSPAFRDS